MTAPQLWYAIRPDLLTVYQGMIMTRRKALVMRRQYGEWSSEYLPAAFALEGKTVLDVGAGCGETVKFYTDRGARRVLAVECNRLESFCLKLNARRMRWDVPAVAEHFFTTRDLTRLGHFDFCKMDIEGGELALLELERLDFPIILESHSPRITRSLVNRFHSLRRKCLTEQGFEVLTNC